MSAAPLPNAAPPPPPPRASPWLAADAPLPSMGAQGVSVLSWNVLLPNSVDGWWIYKYYGADANAAGAPAWPARAALLREVESRWRVASGTARFTTRSHTPSHVALLGWVRLAIE